MATNSARSLRLLREMAYEDAAVRARIREARTAAGLTQKEVADALQVHHNTPGNWEREYTPTMGELARLAPIIKTTLNWLLYGEDAPVEGLSERLDRMEQMLEEVLRRLPPLAASL